MNHSKVFVKDYNERVSAARENGVAVIDTQRRAEGMRSMLIEKAEKTFYITSISINEKGGAMLSLLACAPNRETSEIPIGRATIKSTQPQLTAKAAETLQRQAEDAEVKDLGNGQVQRAQYGVCLRTVERYSRAMINIEVADSVGLGKISSRIYRTGKGAAEDFFVNSLIPGKVHSLLTGRECNKEIIFNADGSVKDGVLIYNDKSIGGATASPGQIKKGDVTFPCVNMDGYDVSQRWSKMTYGGSEKVLVPQESSYKEIAQHNVRYSAYKSSSVDLNEVGTVAYFMGKMVFPGTDDEFRDGFAFASAEFVAECFTAKHSERYLVTPSAVAGIFIQCRPWLNKVLAEVTMRRYIEGVIRFLDKDVIVLDRNNLKEGDQEDFDLCFDKKNKTKSKFWGKLVVVTDTPDDYAIDFFTDLNGLKASYDLSRPSCLNMLDMSHTEHHIETGATTSTQLVQSLMVLNAKKTEEICARLGDAMVEGVRSSIMREDGVAPRWSDFQGDSVNYTQLLQGIAPTFIRESYRPLFKSVANAAIEGLTTSASSLNYKTKGAYAKITTDPAADFGVRILGVDEEGGVEVLCPVASRKRISRLVGIKYPKMHFLEYLKGKVVSIKDYIQRVEDSALSDWQKCLVIELAKSITGGAIVVPAVERLKNMLAGMDFDGDAMTLYFDEDIVDILFKEVPLAISIENDPTTDRQEKQEDAFNQKKLFASA